MDDDGITWNGPRCPECSRELDAEPISADQQIKIAYLCTTHGVISLDDPFPDP